MKTIFLCLMVVYIGGNVFASNCGQGWREFQDNCYFFSPKKMNWRDARKECEKRKASLASVTSEDEHNFIVEQIILAGTSHNWIGGNDIGREGVWVWENTGEKIKTSKFTTWHPGQPSNDKKEQHCLLMNGSAGYNWTDIKCANRYSFTCEKPSKQEGSPCQTTTKNCCGCPVHC